MKYDFDEIIERRGSNSLKYDCAEERGMPDGLLPLWVADMDFRTPPPVVEALKEVAAHGIFGYSMAKEPYYAALQAWFSRHFRYETEREWIVQSPGVVFAISTAVRAFSGEGDGVLIQRPVYYPFSSSIRANGRKIINSPLVLEDGKYLIDFEDFERKIVENHVGLFIFCSPHNPVGRVWTEEELKRTGEICLKHGVVVVSDEIHCDFVFPGHRHTVFAGISPAFADISLTCTAPSKTFNMPGLQISNILIPNRNLRQRFKQEIHKTGYDEMNVFGLAACRSAYADGGEWLDALRAYLLGNLNFLRGYIKEQLPGIKLIEPEGTYLAWLDCRALGLSAGELDDWVVKKAGLWLDGGVMFGEEGAGFQRINIACPRSLLQQALAQLKGAFVSG
ncbi:MAG: pyridoxal phosphate-dependent aminotransferase [Clostridiales Family XIII bacterium]|jgi:cystathionine beta-lyase|nr:pyridoxal phosphate-dependent aminotransferase [Clostridiales Family XIII bacterium]